MNSLFLTVIAWGLAISSTALLFLRIYMIMTENEITVLLNRMQGIRYEYPLKIPALLSFVSWAWILTN